MSRLRYAVASRRMWGDARFRALSSGNPTARELWLYLMTCRVTPVLPGLFVLGLNEITRDLRWPLPGTLAVWAELEKAEPEPLALADWEAPLVWLPKAIRHDPPSNSNHVKGWAARWVDLPDSKLLDRVWLGCVEELKRLKPSLAHAFAHGIPRPSPMYASLLSLSRSLPLPLTPADAGRARVPERAGACAREEQAPDQKSQNAGGGSNSNGEERETVCPLDLESRAVELGVISDLAKALRTSDESVLEAVREFVAYWTIGAGAGKRRAHWMAKLRQRVLELHTQGRLKPPGAIEHESNTRTPRDARALEEAKRVRARLDAELEAERKAAGQ